MQAPAAEILERMRARHRESDEAQVRNIHSHRYEQDMARKLAEVAGLAGGADELRERLREAREHRKEPGSVADLSEFLDNAGLEQLREVAVERLAELQTHRTPLRERKEALEREYAARVEQFQQQVGTDHQASLRRDIEGIQKRVEEHQNLMDCLDSTTAEELRETISAEQERDQTASAEAEDAMARAAEEEARKVVAETERIQKEMEKRAQELAEHVEKLREQAEAAQEIAELEAVLAQLEQKLAELNNLLEQLTEELEDVTMTMKTEAAGEAQEGQNEAQEKQGSQAQEALMQALETVISALASQISAASSNPFGAALVAALMAALKAAQSQQKDASNRKNMHDQKAQRHQGLKDGHKNRKEALAATQQGLRNSISSTKQARESLMVEMSQTRAKIGEKKVNVAHG
jgi:chromosome segregation ATPase